MQRALPSPLRILCCVTAFAMSACAPDIESEAVVIDTITADDPRISALAADPEFALFLDLSVQITGQRLEFWRNASDSADTQAILSSDPAFAEAIASGQIDASGLIQAIGIDPGTVAERDYLIASIVDRHQLNPPHVSPSVTRQAMMQAAMTPSRLTQILVAMDEQEREDADSSEPPPPSGSCEQRCLDAYAEATARIHADNGADVVVSGNDLNALAEAVALMQTRMDRAWVDRQDCLDRCRSLPAMKCRNDSDCNDGEFCKRIGLIARECAPQRERGDPCGRDGACLSGCCRYDPFTHLFSGTCKPDNRCD